MDVFQCWLAFYCNLSLISDWQGRSRALAAVLMFSSRCRGGRRERVCVVGLRPGKTALLAFLQSRYSALSWLSRKARSSASVAKEGAGSPAMLPLSGHQAVLLCTSPPKSIYRRSPDAIRGRSAHRPNHFISTRRAAQAVLTPYGAIMRISLPVLALKLPAAALNSKLTLRSKGAGEFR